MNQDTILINKKLIEFIETVNKATNTKKITNKL